MKFQLFFILIACCIPQIYAQDKRVEISPRALDTGGYATKSVFPENISCSNSNNKFSGDDFWLGNYNLSLDYGMDNEYSPFPMHYSYYVEISKDSCTFFCTGSTILGISIIFSYLCRAVEKDNKLHLHYIKSTDNAVMQNNPPMDTLLVLSINDNEYFIESPFIAGKEGMYNTKMKIKKLKNE